MIYDEQIEKEGREYYNTLISLYRAVQNDSFALVYQPKIRLKDNTLEGVEALLRWNDNAYSHIPIYQVIKIAEDAEFITEITKWVIENAIIQLKSWQEEGIHTKIAVNLSSKDLKDNTLLDFTEECIKTYQIRPELLEFELTERTIIEDEEKVIGVLNKIKEIGIQVSLDDYGTGHNSLKHLTKLMFHFEYIKIDKVFIDEIKLNQILIEGVIRAAHVLGIEVIAEGVETEEQLQILKDAGCDIIQGYYFSKPLSPQLYKAFLELRKDIA